MPTVAQALLPSTVCSAFPEVARLSIIMFAITIIVIVSSSSCSSSPSLLQCHHYHVRHHHLGNSVILFLFLIFTGIKRSYCNRYDQSTTIYSFSFSYDHHYHQDLIQLIRLLEDHSTTSDGIAVYQVAYQVLSE